MRGRSQAEMEGNMDNLNKPSYVFSEPKTEELTVMVVRDGVQYINPNINVIIDDRKLTLYALNPNHERGKNKAYLFDKVLGYNLSNYQELKTKIREGLSKYPVTSKSMTEHGIKYTVEMNNIGTDRQIPCGYWVDRSNGKVYPPNNGLPH